MIPPPIALGLTLCEQVIVDAGTQRVSLINTFNVFAGDEFPFDPLPFCVFAPLTGGEGEAEITLAVTLLETDEEVYSLLRRVNFPDRFLEVRLLFRLTEFTFPVPGGYLFTLMVDEDWIAHRRIQVAQREENV